MFDLRSFGIAVPATCALAGVAAAADAHLRVVDVGAGLCVIASTPDGHNLLYDAGHWNGGQCAASVAELVTDGEIDLVVLSHSDSDHLGDLADILANARADIIVHTGSRREDTATWRGANDAISAEAADEGASIINLETWGLAPGSEFFLGDATATFVAGWHEWDLSLSNPGSLGPSASERRNAISIVMRFEYGGHSVLLTGDSIGRRIRDQEPDACRDAERWMTENANAVALTSDVLVASHHGGDNGSAACFIEAVDPEFVIFSAGHDHGHPRHNAAERFLAHGIPLEAIFRTDLGDHEASEPEEWAEGRIEGCPDPIGDDHVDIWLPSEPEQPVRVEYAGESAVCE